MNAQRPVVLAMLCVMLASRSEGQRLPAEFPRFQPRPSALQQPDTAIRPPTQVVKDYTWEGAAIGGLALGLFGASFASGMCGMDDRGGSHCAASALVGFLGGASIGATLGGMIGSGKKKAPYSPAADSALFPRGRSRGGNGTALGAVLVGGGVAVFTTLGCSLDRSGEHENCAWNAVRYGAIGAASGGLLGALLGTSSKSVDRPEEPK